MTQRQRWTVFAVVVVFLLASAVGGVDRRNGPHRSPGAATPATTPSPYPHAWEAKR